MCVTRVYFCKYTHSALWTLKVQFEKKCSDRHVSAGNLLSPATTEILCFTSMAENHPRLLHKRNSVLVLDYFQISGIFLYSSRTAFGPLPSSWTNALQCY